MNDGLLERYRRDGYVAIKDLVGPQEVTELRDEAARLCLDKGKALGGGSDRTQSDPLAAYLAIHFPRTKSRSVLWRSMRSIGMRSANSPSASRLRRG